MSTAGHAGGANPARMHNYLLGGKDHNRADRATCLKLLQHLPDLLPAVRAARAFTHRAVAHLAGHAGIGQFIDLGCGLPMPPAVHEIARRHGPAPRVVYVDDDPVVAAYARALLAVDPATAAVEADLTRPERIVTDPHTEAVIDLSRPVAVLLVNVGHLLHDDTIRRVAATVTATLAPGSYLATAHLVGADAPATALANRVAAELGLAWRFRTRTQTRKLLAGLRPVAPGMVNVTSWRPRSQAQPQVHSPGQVPERAGSAALVAYGGVLTIPRSGHGTRPVDAGKTRASSDRRRPVGQP